jgi:Uracil phosphoribosyltransferase
MSLNSSALDELPYRPKTVETPGEHNYNGLEISAKVCGVEIVRAGGAMRTSFSRNFNDAAIGKILIHTSEIGEPLLHFVKLPNNISSLRVIVMVSYPHVLELMLGRTNSDCICSNRFDGHTYPARPWRCGITHYLYYDSRQRKRSPYACSSISTSQSYCRGSRRDFDRRGGYPERKMVRRLRLQLH